MRNAAGEKKVLLEFGLIEMQKEKDLVMYYNPGSYF